MKLLFDQNLARRLVTALDDLFPESLHVRDCALAAATDVEVWAYAVSNEFAIVTKDADFRQLSFLLGAPPKVIWIRTGNCTTERIATIIRTRAIEIHAFGENPVLAFLSLS